jgi:hypothetical protein
MVAEGRDVNAQRRDVTIQRRDVTFQRRVVTTARHDTETGQRDGSDVSDPRFRTRRQMAATVVGQAASTSLMAADVPVRGPRKAVFCVSNVNPNYKCDDIVKYCADNHIIVSKCFDVTPSNPRRFSRCFRITCLASATDNILDASMWPSRVTVRPWTFSHPVRSITEGYAEGSQGEGASSKDYAMDIETLAQSDNGSVHVVQALNDRSFVGAPQSVDMPSVVPGLTVTNNDTVPLSDVLQAANLVLNGDC